MRASELFPGLTVLRRYQRGWLRGDMLAGVTVGAYLVPQVLAYAGLAGVPPVAGLWATLPDLADRGRGVRIVARRPELGRSAALTWLPAWRGDGRQLRPGLRRHRLQHAGLPAGLPAGT